MYITIKVAGVENISARLTQTGNSINRVSIPALKELDRKLGETLKSMFSPAKGGSVRGKTYKHGYTGKYLSGLRHTVSENGLIISESVQDGGRHLRTGTKPSSVLNDQGQPIVPYAVRQWAMDKLGVNPNVAYSISRTIAEHGIGWVGGTSPIPKEHPLGSSRSEYAEYIVNTKNKRDIEAAAAAIGTLTVKYLTGGK